MTSLRLRPATRCDAYTLWIWANDAITRDASGKRPPIEWEEHLKWLERLLSSEAAAVFVAVADEQPIGYIRFQTADGWRSARLSYAVAPESRGRGYGAAIVTNGTRSFAAAHASTRVYARVAVDNQRSRRIFARLRWNAGPEPQDGTIEFAMPVGRLGMNV